MSVVLGIDPGLASTGFGVISQEGSTIRCLDYGVFTTASDQSVGARLDHIQREVEALLQRFSPDSAGIEGLYFTKNITSAIPVAQARGVILLTLYRAGIHAREYTPQQIKQAVVGTGQADKEQVMQMVRVILGHPTVPRPDHAADALAAAVTRLHDGMDRLTGGR